ncbi:hypothetical protein GCM10025866_17970 [Naasia aerilata]|uniref:Glycosyltransferase 2-like domain-containing protein n=1 Tax=Naasia aerilata TaxID=1162966 RepID=A0ABM8GCB2_9MICO|nr:hypothetical protein GCM10025866_17970 [Naasia aerilata]
MAVIVRTKDRPYFLRRALADIAGQTFTDAEVLVVNDGGDEAAVQAVLEESGIQDRITVLNTPGKAGRCAAANAGIRATTAPYVVLHDDDDLWHADFLLRTVATLDESPADAGVVVATEIVIEERSEDGWSAVGRAPFWEGLTGITFTSLLEVNRAVPISFLYRRSIHDEVGYYDESLLTVEDWDFYLRVAAKHPVAFLGGEALAFWTHRPAAEGADSNSMFELAGQHSRDDLAVRDLALRAWVAENGPGLPLYIALVERRLRRTSTAASS